MNWRCINEPVTEFTLDYGGLRDAVIHNNLAHLQACVDAKLDLNYRYGYGYSLLFYATTPECMQFLLDHGVDPHYRTYEDITALQYLSLNSNDAVDAVKLLLDAGVDLNIVDRIDGRTAMHRAVQNNNLQILRELVQRGANTQIRDFNNKNPLAFACSPESIDILNSPMTKCILL